MQLEITGKIIEVSPVKVINPTFRTREFVLDISTEYNGILYEDYAVMQTRNGACDLLSEDPFTDTIRFIIGDRVKVTFSLKGSKGKHNDVYYNNLNAFKIEAAAQQYEAVPAAPPVAARPPVTPAPAQYPTPQPGYQPSMDVPPMIDDLPF